MPRKSPSRSLRNFLTLVNLTVMVCTISSFTLPRPGISLGRSLLVSQRDLFSLALPSSLAATTTRTLSALRDGTHHRGYEYSSSSRNKNGTSDTEASVLPSTPKLDPMIVCGPSGVGKGTIIQKYMTERGGDRRFQFTVSHTTRPPRPGEVDGVHYHFVSHQAMLDLVRERSFVESAHVHGNYYGTSWDAMRAVQSTGKRCLLDIDVQGVVRIKQLARNVDGGNSGDVDEATDLFLGTPRESARPFVSSSTTSYLSTLSSSPPSSFSSDVSDSPAYPWLRPKYLFIAPPSLEALEARLLGRRSESPESFRRRIDNARAELEYGLARGNFDAVVVNDDLESAVLDFERAVRLLYEVRDGEANDS